MRITVYIAMLISAAMASPTMVVRDVGCIPAEDDSLDKRCVGFEVKTDLLCMSPSICSPNLGFRSSRGRARGGTAQLAPRCRLHSS